jgi:hypothetical protein
VEHNRAPAYNLMLHRPNMVEKRRKRDMVATLNTQMLQYLESSYDTTRENLLQH